jgi:hypothetical protein
VVLHVVHSIRTGEADCAEAITSEEGSNGHPQGCPTYAAPSRGISTASPCQGDVEAGHDPLQRHCLKPPPSGFTAIGVLDTPPIERQEHAALDDLLHLDIKA